MKTIIFIRTAPYNYKLPGKLLYKSLDEIGQQIANPYIQDLRTLTTKYAERNKTSQHLTKPTA